MEVEVLALGAGGTRLYHFDIVYITLHRLVFNQALVLGQSTAEVREMGSEKHRTEFQMGHTVLGSVLRSSDYGTSGSPLHSCLPPVPSLYRLHSSCHRVNTILLTDSHPPWGFSVTDVLTRTRSGPESGRLSVCVMLSVWGKFRS